VSDFTRAEVCVIACAETFRGDGEIVANPIGTIPILGGRLARATFEPELVLTDGEALFVANDLPVGVPDAPKVVEGWNPYRMMLEVTWSGRRHVMMGATQIDRFGNQNIACIGSLDAPKVQLLGFRGAPGNTINDPTSYWVPNHSPKVFVEHVDVVTGIGYDRAAELGPEAARFHRIPRVVSNLATFDFETPSQTMRLRSVHPGVTTDEVVAATGFELVIPDGVPESRTPTTEELALLRDVLDPNDLRGKEVPG
jgi:acyl CoA:acetate/3-ketoacid CoA transferase beta subunit